MFQTDEYTAIRALMTNYLNTGTTQTPSRGRGQRTIKRSERYAELLDDEETLEPVSNFSLKLTCILKLYVKI